MALPVVPFVAGFATGSAVTWLYQDERTQAAIHRQLAEPGKRLTRSVGEAGKGLGRARDGIIALGPSKAAEPAQKDRPDEPQRLETVPEQPGEGQSAPST